MRSSDFAPSIDKPHSNFPWPIMTGPAAKSVEALALEGSSGRRSLERSQSLLG